jgi:hypothetical protein
LLLPLVVMGVAGRAHARHVHDDGAHAEAPHDSKAQEAARIADDYALAREDTRKIGRALDALMVRYDYPALRKRMSARFSRALSDDDLDATFPLFANEPPRDETVLIAAPKDRDYEVDRAVADGKVWGIKMIIDDQGLLDGLSVRERTPLPDDVHVGEPPLALELPVRIPVVFFQGGEDSLHNLHVWNPDQRHAFDIVGWKDGGSFGDSKGQSNDDYVIWDVEVHAPVEGRIVGKKDGIRDNVPGSLNYDQPFGNYVVIERKPGVFVVLGHLRLHSIAVSVGDVVKAGDVVAHVGNSGTSTEPHLHIHAQDKKVVKTGQGFPVVFRNYAVDGTHRDLGIPQRGELITPSRARKTRHSRKEPVR